MKKFQFLLLDAGPIIKLFELGIWDAFIEKCDVTISKIVADEAKWASQEFQDIRIDLEPYEAIIKVIDLEPAIVKSFYEKFNLRYKAGIHDGEKETLAFLCESPENWSVCSADAAVFMVLGLLGKGNQGISLQEILQKIGLSQSSLEWEYTKKFREKYTRMGRIDSVQHKGPL